MTYTNKERAEYSEQRKRACERNGITENQYNWLRRKGQALHAHYERNCNGTTTEADYSRNTNLLYESVEKYVKKLNLHVYFQTDPRGATIYIDREPLTDSAYNRGTVIY
jgi:hypothetical protein